MNEKTLTLTLTEREVREVVAALKNKRGTLEAYVAANTNSITSKPIDAELGEMFEVRRTEVDDLITKVLAVKADDIASAPAAEAVKAPVIASPPRPARGAARRWHALTMRCPAAAGRPARAEPPPR